VSENPVGYAWLMDRHGVRSPRPRHTSTVRTTAGSRIPKRDGFHEEESFPSQYRPADDDFDHLVFALKYDGVDLCVLKQVFAVIDPERFAAKILAQPTSAYGRRLFFFYELLTGHRLDIGELPKVAYCEALESEGYFVSVGVRRTRHRVIDNLLGDGTFCPIVRRTSTLENWTRRDFRARALEITSGTDALLLRRAIWYLYTKETKSSFAIEREEPGAKTERFAEQLGSAASVRFEDEAELVRLQNEMVQPPYGETRFRRSGDAEVYVGQTVGLKERIHHVGARSEVTPDLMTGWSRMRSLLGPGGAVVEAACRAFAFVFIHPFGDGNGRIHRLLLHSVLARRDYLPHHIVVPISAVILRHMDQYDQVLEDFSRRVMPLVDYRIDEEGEMTIASAPDDAYRYPDLTPQCEATYFWLDRALEEDLLQQLAFLRGYDEMIPRFRAIVEMPDKKEQLFIKLCLDNGGRLPKRKRDRFAELSDETIERLETIVAEAMKLTP
jgi:hypothetical protein